MHRFPGFAGRVILPEGRPPAGTKHPSTSAAGALAKFAAANRERLGDKLLYTHMEKDKHLIQFLTGLSPENQIKPCYHPPGPGLPPFCVNVLC